jgi:glycosyltransferase involved in cell wall biosynthesis
MRRPIVINATNLGSYLNGIGVYVLNLLRELALNSNGAPCIVYVNRSAKKYVEEIPFGPEWDIRWVNRFTSPDLGFKGHCVRLLVAQWLGLRHWRHVIFSASQLEVIFFRRNQIVMIHDLIPLLFRSLHKKQYHYFRHILPRVLHRARWIVSPSNHTKEAIVKEYGMQAGKIRVIHNGVSRVHESRECSGVVDAYILFSGRMSPLKNLPGVLKAFSLIEDKIPHRMIVTGGDRRRRRRTDLPAPAECVVGDRVEFRGHVSPDEMENLLSGASLVVFPSFYEGFGLPPLEGMAHGCPVVVSNVSSLPEVCGDAAEYVDPADPASIAHGMLNLLTNRELRDIRVTSGLQRARTFLWKDSALHHLALFHIAIKQCDHRRSAIPPLQWRIGLALQANPVLALIASWFFRHHGR